MIDFYHYKYTTPLPGASEKPYDFLQLVPVGIVIFIIPKVVFTCPGRTAATTTEAEDGAFAALSYNIGDGIDKQRALHLQFFHLDFGIHICLFHCSVLLLLYHHLFAIIDVDAFLGWFASEFATTYVIPCGSLIFNLQF